MSSLEERRVKGLPRILLATGLVGLLVVAGFVVGGTVVEQRNTQAGASTASNSSQTTQNNKGDIQPDAVALTLAEVQMLDKGDSKKMWVPDAAGNAVGYVDQDAFFAIPTDPPGEPLRSIFGDNPGYLVRNDKDQPIGYFAPGIGYMSFAEADSRGLSGKAPRPAH
jgi:hypothetical protein